MKKKIAWEGARRRGSSSPPEGERLYGYICSGGLFLRLGLFTSWVCVRSSHVCVSFCLLVCLLAMEVFLDDMIENYVKNDIRVWGRGGGYWRDEVI